MLQLWYRNVWGAGELCHTKGMLPYSIVELCPALSICVLLGNGCQVYETQTVAAPRGRCATLWRTRSSRPWINTNVSDSCVHVHPSEVTTLTSTCQRTRRNSRKHYPRAAQSQGKLYDKVRSPVVAVTSPNTPGPRCWQRSFIQH